MTSNPLAPRLPRLGTFVKTPSHQVIEVLGTTDFAFGLIDAEHAPFDLHAIDLAMLAGRAAQLPLYVRLRSHSPEDILSVLDMGACGIVAPQVSNAREAGDIVSAARFHKGTRGYSGSPRSAGYGSLPPLEARANGDSTEIICQIEDVAGLGHAQAIAATEGVSSLFVGRADLALAMGEKNSRSPAVLAATEKIAAAAHKEGKSVWVYCAASEWQEFSSRGIDTIVIESDQSLMTLAAEAIFEGINIA